MEIPTSLQFTLLSDHPRYYISNILGPTGHVPSAGPVTVARVVGLLGLHCLVRMLQPQSLRSLQLQLKMKHRSMGSEERVPPKENQGSYQESQWVQEGSLIIIIIINASFYGLQCISRCIFLFDVKNVSRRQNKEVIKHMDPGARLSLIINCISFWTNHLTSRYSSFFNCAIGIKTLTFKGSRRNKLIDICWALSTETYVCWSLCLWVQLLSISFDRCGNLKSRVL